MSCINIHPPTPSSGPMAFGFVSTRDYRCVPEKNWIVFSNILNIISYPLSPLIGLVRIVVNAYFLYKDKNLDGKAWNENDRNYLWAQIGRGALELIGGGYLLWVVDIIMTDFRSIDPEGPSLKNCFNASNASPDSYTIM